MHCLVRRFPPITCGDPYELLDTGVNFFVLCLEELGAETWASCDGHDGKGEFYILFTATYELAVLISRIGYFRVEVERGPNMFSIRMSPRGEPAEWWRRGLRWAADAWVEKLGVGNRVRKWVELNEYPDSFWSAGSSIRPEEAGGLSRVLSAED